MPPPVWAALIGAVGALAGVATGSFLSGWYQRQAWMRELAARSRDERRRLFAEFLTTAREWRGAAQHSDTKLVDASAVSKNKHADGGAAAARTLALRSEIALVGQTSTIRAAREMAKAHTRLAESRGKYAAGSLPQPLVDACRSTEMRFVHAAREELGVLSSKADLEEVFGLTPDRLSS
jgi:hypothetical protein